MTKSPPHHGLIPGVIYRRTSTERQAEKVSPEKQLSDAEAYAHEHGITLVAVYSDLERYRVRGRMVEPSAERSDRPEFQRMLADAHARKFKAIIAWKEDRLYRGIKPAVLVDDLIEATAVQIHLVKETFDRKMLFLKAAIGRLENESRNERTAMGRAGRLEKGLPHGGRVPHGYLALKDRQGITVGYEIDPAWRWFFDELAIRFLRRESYYKISQALGHNAPSGLAWPASTIRYFLRNPFYKGKIASGWNDGPPTFVGQGVQPAAWDEATCAAIERESERRAQNTKSGPRSTGLLSGIVRCGICGGLMATSCARPYTLSDGTIKHYRTYGCYRPIYVRRGIWLEPTHTSNYINELKLMGLVRATFARLTVAQVDDWLDGMALLESQRAPDPARQARLIAEQAALSGKLQDLTVGLDGIRHASPAAAEAIIAEMRRTGQKLDGVREDLLRIEQHQSALPNLVQARAAMIRLIQHPELLDRPAGELRPILQAALPALYIRGGALAAPVAAWPVHTQKVAAG